MLFQFLNSVTYSNTSYDSLRIHQDFLKIVAIIDTSSNYKYSLELCREWGLKTNFEKYFLKESCLIQELKIHKKFNKYSEGLDLALNINEQISYGDITLSCRNVEYLERYLYEYMLVINNHKKAISHLKKIKGLACFDNGIYSIIDYEIGLSYLSNLQYDSIYAIFNNIIINLHFENDTA